MNTAISGYDAEGRLISGDELRKQDAEIKKELAQVLRAHKLTVGQASALLREYSQELVVDLCQALL